MVKQEGLSASRPRRVLSAFVKSEKSLLLVLKGKKALLVYRGRVTTMTWIGRFAHWNAWVKKSDVSYVYTTSFPQRNAYVQAKLSLWKRFQNNVSQTHFLSDLYFLTSLFTWCSRFTSFSLLCSEKNIRSIVSKSELNQPLWRPCAGFAWQLMLVHRFTMKRSWGENNWQEAPVSVYFSFFGYHSRSANLCLCLWTDPESHNHLLSLN